DEYGTGSAYVDPVFTLPAEFRNLVNIVGVPAAPIPEPASWALMLCGLGVLGRTMLRRREILHRQNPCAARV
ncbi:MAG: PEPxxWA-CTERM sorting domain-containing protein, partial [Burkholderiales bacterium]|nr:PEPxxWA-CTERM sorting domain-containing protein [Burkholderiales bacterium]